jgi:PAS domain-containing protein
VEIGDAESVTASVPRRVDLADLLSALQLMPVATVILSCDGWAVGVNQAWCELTGLGDEESRGEGWSKILRIHDRHQLVGALGDLAASGGAASAECQVQLLGQPRRTRWFLRERDLGAGRVAIATVIEMDGHYPGRRDLAALTDQVGWLAARIRDLAATQPSDAAVLLDASHNLYRAFVTLTLDPGRGNGRPVPTYAGNLTGHFPS